MTPADERALVEKVVDVLRGALHDIAPLRVYPDDEAAELIGLRGPTRGMQIRKLPIPRVRITRGGKKIGYQGKDLIAWIERRKEGVHGLPAERQAGLVDEAEAAGIRPRRAVEGWRGHARGG